MQIKMLAGTALQLARELYDGPSAPLTEINSNEAREALDPEWWSTSEKAEGVDSDRHLGALRLYAAVGKHASHLNSDGAAFPAVFDFEDRRLMRPDKGAVKSFIANGLVTHRKMGAQLVFDLTGAARKKLDENDQ